MRFIEVLKAILYGIVEGITEWLPISSTGHMILLDEWVKLDISKEFWDLFLVVIQIGAIFAVIILFFNRLNPLCRNKEGKGIHLKKDVLLIWAKVLVACVPLAIVGILFDDWVNDRFYNFRTVATTLILYGALFIIIELYNKKRTTKIETVMDITFNMAFLIGLIQVLSIIPGTSRSGVTILGAMLLGCSRTASAEFSFFLSVPVMLGASLLKCLKYAMDFGLPSTNEMLLLLIGCITALIVSLIVIKGLMSFIKKHDFKPFGIYRIVLGIILIVYFLCI